MNLSISLGALAALQLLSSLALQILVLVLVGAGDETDAWVAAQAVPVVIYSIVAVAFQGTWQSALAVAQGQSAWRQAQQAAHGQLILLMGAVVLLLIGAAPLWVSWVFPGFSPDQASLATGLATILLPGALLNGHTILLTTALRGRDRFITAEVVALAGAIGMLGAVAWAVPRHGVEAAAWSSLGRSLLVFVVLFVMANHPWPNVREGWKAASYWRSLRPLLLGSTFYKTGPLVDRFWGSMAATGGMTAYHLVLTGMSALASVLERALCVPVVPSLARHANARDYTAVRRVYRSSVARASAYAAAILAIIVALYPVWPRIAGWLKLDAGMTQQSWWISLVLVGYLLPAASGSVVVSSFYALGDTRTPVRVGVIGFALSLAAKAVGFLTAGLPGLACATVVHYAGNMFVMCILLERRLGNLSTKDNETSAS